MNPGVYIFELLFEYDCVIIPGFGGFIGNYAPARIQPAYHTFLPPRKSLLFNVNLKQNDGLLAFWISRKTNIEYNDALHLIESAVTGWNKELNAGRFVEIDRVGRLFKDKEGNIQFEQDEQFNFLPESFGLTSVVSPVINRNETRSQIEKRKNLYAATDENERRSVSRALKWAAILALPIGTAAVFGITHFEKIKSLSVAYSGLLISNSANEPVRINHTIRTSPPSIKTERNEAVISQSVSEPVKQTDEGQTAEKEKPYLIIVGAFKFFENAEGLVADLKAKGYNASLAGQTKTGLYRVSLHSFTSKEEAFRQLELVRSNEFSSAWLLVK